MCLDNPVFAIDLYSLCSPASRLQPTVGVHRSFAVAWLVSEETNSAGCGMELQLLDAVPPGGALTAERQFFSQGNSVVTVSFVLQCTCCKNGGVDSAASSSQPQTDLQSAPSSDGMCGICGEVPPVKRSTLCAPPSLLELPVLCFALCCSSCSATCG